LHVTPVLHKKFLSEKLFETAGLTVRRQDAINLFLRLFFTICLGC
jgi:hypothetical protein